LAGGIPAVLLACSHSGALLRAHFVSVAGSDVTLVSSGQETAARQSARLVGCE
jgi:glutamate racemase